MGCFSGCFGIRDDPRTQINRFPPPITAIHKEPDDPLASNCVWSPLAYEDKDEDLSQCEDGRYGVTGSLTLDDDLRAEAKFLKDCGTLSQTPVELRKTKKTKDSQPQYEDREFESNSRLPNTGFEFEESLQMQPDQLQSPIDLFQKWENKSDSTSHSSNSLKNTDSFSSNSDEGCMIGKNKSVHFESESDSCSSSSKRPSPEITKIPLKPYDHTIPKSTSYPTRLKSVHFQSQSDSSSSSSSSESSSPEITKIPLKPHEPPYDHTIPKPTSYPTSLKSVHFESQSDSSSSKSSSPEITKKPLKPYESPYDHTISKPTPHPTPLKSVHFVSQVDSSSSKSSSPKITKIPLKPYESPYDHTISKLTPYPTPLKLTDDMQSPGTVFPSYGKNSRIRSQYVYFSQLNTPIEEEIIENSDKESPKSQLKLQESTTKKELDVCPTLSSWLSQKSNQEICVDQTLTGQTPGERSIPGVNSSWLPPKSNQEVCVDQSLTGQTPGERPILGVLTFECNADETEFTPKLGDINGIPNTTNKYREHQKVSWHATPFEERLEKALSEEKFVPKMNQFGETRCVEF